MSGGRFQYKQYDIEIIAETIESIISKNRKPIDPKDRKPWDDSEFYYDYPDEVIEKFKLAVKHLKIAAVYAQRVDWLLSGDDGEDNFFIRLEEDLKELGNISEMG